MSATADVGVERAGEALVARLSGEVDMTNVSFVREEITGAVPNDVALVVIDLSDTSYLDSAAIEVLFEALAAARAPAPAAAARTASDVASAPPADGVRRGRSRADSREPCAGARRGVASPENRGEESARAP